MPQILTSWACMLTDLNAQVVDSIAGRYVTTVTHLTFPAAIMTSTC